MFKLGDRVYATVLDEQVTIKHWSDKLGSYIVVNGDGEELLCSPEKLTPISTKPTNPKDDVIFGDGTSRLFDLYCKPVIREVKVSNPKDAIGCDKLPLHLWPTTATAMGSIAFLEGALKYGRSNWRESGVKSTIYVDACRRHLDAWLEGEEVAPDTGTPHLSSALACLAIIVDAQAAGKLNDDRNYNGSGYRKLVDKLTPHVRRLKNLFADKNPKHYTIEDNQ